MKKIIQLFAVCLVVAIATAAEPTSSPVFQLRLVVEKPSADSEQMTVQRTNKLTGATSSEKLVVQKKVLLDQTALKSAEVITNKFDENPEIRIVLTAEGQKRFAEVTRQNIHNRLAIVIDGKLVTAPVIQSEIPSGMFQITGNYTEQEAEELAKKINDAVKR